jgi:uncharacterized protein (DUF305 family)
MQLSSLIRTGVAGVCLSIAVGAFADDKATDHSKHDKMQTAAATQSQGSNELHKAMMQGMQDMQRMKMTGETDHDFASMMIKHHEQAIAMSKAQLKNGKDPEVRKKAQEIIAQSEKDISELRKHAEHDGSQKTAAD